MQAFSAVLHMLRKWRASIAASTTIIARLRMLLQLATTGVDHNIDARWLCNYIRCQHQGWQDCCGFAHVSQVKQPASLHQPQSSRQLACPAVMWHTALYGVNNKDEAGLWRYCTWWATTRIAIYSVTSSYTVTSSVDVGNNSEEQLVGLPYTTHMWLKVEQPDSRKGDSTGRREALDLPRPQEQRKACPKLTNRTSTVLRTCAKNPKHLEQFFWLWKNSSIFFVWKWRGQNVLTFR